VRDENQLENRVIDRNVGMTEQRRIRGFEIIKNRDMNNRKVHADD
jgi:hypothetical protein